MSRCPPAQGDIRLSLVVDLANPGVEIR